MIMHNEDDENVCYQFKIRSLETSLTPNQDGTHTLRAVAAGGDPIEFLVHLEPFLITEIDIVEDLNLVKNGVGEVEEIQPMLKLTLTVTAEVRTNPETGHKWQTKVLPRDDCGNPR